MLDIEYLRKQMNERKTLDEFARANNMVSKKHVLSTDCLQYYSMVEEIKILQSKPPSVRRDGLIAECNEFLNANYLTLDERIQEAYEYSDSVCRKNDNLEKEIAIVNKRLLFYTLKQTANDVNLHETTDHCYRFVYSSRALFWLFRRFCNKHDLSYITNC